MPRKVKRKSAPLVVSPPEDDSSSEATAVPNQVKRTKSSGAGAPPFSFVLGVASHPKLPPPRNELPTDQDDPLLGPRFELLLPRSPGCLCELQHFPHCVVASGA